LSHTPNELIDMFPEQSAKIHELKAESGEFARLFDEYHEVTREIHRGETNIEPMDDFRMEELRKRRLQMLDRVTALIK